MDTKKIAIGAGLGLLAYWLFSGKAHAAPGGGSSALPPAGGTLDADALRAMLSRSLLVPSSASPGKEFFVMTSPTPFEPDTDAAGPNNALTLVRIAQRATPVAGTPNLLNESTSADRKIVFIPPGMPRPTSNLILLPTL